MKERPILMSGPLVLATLEGRKTQTRRVMNPQPFEYDGAFEWRGKHFGAFPEPAQKAGDVCPYGPPGNRLWVRETWGVGTRPCPSEGWYEGVEYRADVPALAAERASLPVRRVEGVSLADYEGRGWIPSIHMPRWASRLTLEITEVRVQRVQDISEEDARAEGVEPGPSVAAGDGFHPAGYRSRFRWLWNEINGERLVGGKPVTWAANPWVWCLSYRVVRPAGASNASL